MSNSLISKDREQVVARVVVRTLMVSRPTNYIYSLARTITATSACYYNVSYNVRALETRLVEESRSLSIVKVGWIYILTDSGCTTTRIEVDFK